MARRRPLTMRVLRGILAIERVCGGLHERGEVRGFSVREHDNATAAIAWAVAEIRRRNRERCAPGCMLPVYPDRHSGPCKTAGAILSSFPNDSPY